MLLRAGADPIEKTERGSTTRTLSEGGSGKWQRDTSALSTTSYGDSSSVSQLSLGGSSARPGSPGRSGARSPGRDRIDDVVAAREQALWSLREKRQVERERERIDGAEAELQQHISHQQRRDEKRRLLEISLDVRVSTAHTHTQTHAQPACRLRYGHFDTGTHPCGSCRLAPCAHRSVCLALPLAWNDNNDPNPVSLSSSRRRLSIGTAGITDHIIPVTRGLTTWRVRWRRWRSHGVTTIPRGVAVSLPDRCVSCRADFRITCLRLACQWVHLH